MNVTTLTRLKSEVARKAHIDDGLSLASKNCIGYGRRAKVDAKRLDAQTVAVAVSVEGESMILVFETRCQRQTI